ncbi:SMI1/KNR4 family protein [Actinoplanes sp. NPDC051494]|uniref:SMI1/KNR4 family protein n=1 Tax=Actinoplanes sp. NPDC051494 TaxID=3363907 RepID=UPI0037885DF2
MNEVAVDGGIARIRAKIVALPSTERAVLGPPLTERELSGFEDQLGVRLPAEFREFVTQIGHGGSGPQYGLLPMATWLRPVAGFSGAITVVHGGCSDYTLLVVSGPDRGRLVEVNADGCFAPRFYSDPGFLAWYERWLDFVLTGHRDLTWFPNQMAGDEAALVATLREDPLAARRRAAACTFITYPAPGAGLPEVLVGALSTEPDAAVREMILRALAAQGERGRDLLSAALTDREAGVRSLAAVLMSPRALWGELPPHRRRVLGDHLRAEPDPAVRETIVLLLGQAR